ncbi:MAG TPA: hypothetical protein VNL74_05280 [Methylococcus sp.]|nr:hypothetical protein [Methylococcus sp.]
MSNDRELEELRQFTVEVSLYEHFVTQGYDGMRALRASVVAKHDEIKYLRDPHSIQRAAYLRGMMDGIDGCLKQMAAGMNWGELWIRQPEPKKPRLTLVVDNTAIKNRLSADNDQTA